MRSFAITHIFSIVSFCILSSAAFGYIHTEEQLAKMDKDAKEVEQALENLSKDLSQDQSLKFKKLKIALKSYATSHADNELDAAGTGWADTVRATGEDMLKDFISFFKKLDSGKLTPKSNAEYKKTDIELNRLYRRIQNNPHFDTNVAAAPSKIGIKETQRNWIQYRDAWVEFAALKFPTITQDSLSTALTQERVEILKDL